MITYDNMLDAVAAHCLAYPGRRLHLTNAQLHIGKIDAERLAEWAGSNGLTIEEAVSRGMEGWNIVKEPETANSQAPQPEGSGERPVR